MTLKLCGAKSKTGEPCKGRAMVNGRCWHHGGKSLSGLASPTFKHGRYSKHLPTRLAGRYEEAEHDPELLSLKAEVQLLDARLADVLARVDTGESGWLWQKLKAASSELLYARKTRDDAGMQVALNNILDLIRSGHQDYAAWQDVRSLLDQRTRVAQSEHKRKVDMQQMLSIERFLLLAGALVAVFRDSVQRHVSDDQERRRVLAEASAGVERLISHDDRGGTPG